jgi:hypothetical protein
VHELIRICPGEQSERREFMWAQNRKEELR